MRMSDLKVSLEIVLILFLEEGNEDVWENEFVQKHHSNLMEWLGL